MILPPVSDLREWKAAHSLADIAPHRRAVERSKPRVGARMGEAAQHV